MKKQTKDEFAQQLWAVLNEHNQEDSEVLVLNIRDTFRKIMKCYPEDYEFLNKIKVKVINHSGLELPTYASEGAACIDLCATFKDKNKESFKGKGFDIIVKGTSIAQIRLHAGGHILIPTGLFFELPDDYCFKIKPRSGLALKDRITMLNCEGVIDSDYRGEIGIMLINHNDEFFTINHGDRLAQGSLEKVRRIEFKEVMTLSETARGTGGFGSTGIS